MKKIEKESTMLVNDTNMYEKIEVNFQKEEELKKLKQRLDNVKLKIAKNNG